MLYQKTVHRGPSGGRLNNGNRSFFEGGFLLNVFWLPLLAPTIPSPRRTKNLLVWQVGAVILFRCITDALSLRHSVFPQSLPHGRRDLPTLISGLHRAAAYFREPSREPGHIKTTRKRIPTFRFWLFHRWPGPLGRRKRGGNYVYPNILYNNTICNDTPRYGG